VGDALEVGAGDPTAPVLVAASLSLRAAALARAAAMATLMSVFAPVAVDEVPGVVGRGDPLLDLARFSPLDSSTSG
jgi:hypothetical protein